MKIYKDKNFISLKVNGCDLSAIQLRKIKITETLHNELPTIEIQADVSQQSLNCFVLIGSKIEFEFRYANKQEKYEFMLVSFDVINDGVIYHLTLKGVIYLPKYFQKSFKQEYHKDKTTQELFKKIQFVTPKVRLKSKTKDKQVWIRPNYTEKSWVDYLYNFSWNGMDDLVLCALNFKKELIIDNLKNIKQQKPKKISNFEKETNNLYHTYRFQKRVSILDYKLSPLRKIRSFDVPLHKITEYTIPTYSLFTKKPYNDLKTYYPFKVLLNNMNTYKEYIYAFRYNQVLRKRLHFFEIELNMNTIGFADINLLDYVEFKEFDVKSKKPVILTGGNYIVSKRELVFTLQGLTEYKITISRDYFLKG